MNTVLISYQHVSKYAFTILVLRIYVAYITWTICLNIFFVDIHLQSFPSLSQLFLSYLLSSYNSQDTEVDIIAKNCVPQYQNTLQLLLNSLFYAPWQVKDILKPEVMEEIVMLTQQKLLDQKG